MLFDDRHDTFELSDTRVIDDLPVGRQAETRLSWTRETSAAVTSSLSASGSMSLPNVVVRLRRRAIQPSSASVIDARTNTMAARASPLPASCNSAATRTGTSRMRRTVRTFGKLSSNTVPNVTQRLGLPLALIHRAGGSVPSGRERRMTS